MSEEPEGKLCPMMVGVGGYCSEDRCAWWHTTEFSDGEDEAGCAVMAIARGALVAAGGMDALATVAETMAALVPRGGNHAA